MTTTPTGSSVPISAALPHLYLFLLLTLLHHHLPLAAAQSQYYGVNAIGSLSSSVAILLVGVLVCSLFAGLLFLYVHGCTTSLLFLTTSAIPGNGASCSATIGIDKSAIEKLPVIIFSADEARSEPGIGLTDCIVCLNEFQDGEILRSLPRCKHAFHYECIERWLLSHPTCPVCRADLLAETKELAAGGGGNGVDHRVTSEEESESVVVEIVGCQPSGDSACRSTSTGCSLSRLGEKSERMTATVTQDQPSVIVGAEMH